MAKMFLKTITHFRLPHHVDRTGQPMMQTADNIPMITWPDSRWCVEANVYMLELYEKGRSRREGGTLQQQAKAIIQFLELCHGQVELINLTDSWLTMFVNALKKRKLEKDSSDNRVLAVARYWCSFLNSVGEFHDMPKFIGKNGRIRAEQKEFTIRSSNGKEFKRKSWSHRSFPVEGAYKRRDPITDDNIRKLRKAVLPVSKGGPVYIRKRRYTMLKVLEITGGRRMEVALLTVGSVRDAEAMIGDSKLESPPMLTLETVKKRTLDTREVPINKPDLENLVGYINGARARLIKRLKRRNLQYKDPGTLLLNEKTGQPLISNTITQEIGKLKRVAGIKQKVSPHTFRHRFCTKVMVALIERHQCETEDDWRRLLIDKESVAKVLCEWTGHKNLSSLEVYLHLALREAANFKKTYIKVNLDRTIESSKSNLLQLKQEALAGDLTSLELLQAVMREIDLLSTELAEEEEL